MPPSERARWCKRSSPAWLLLLGLSWPAQARAQPTDLVSLDWSAPAECPRAEEVQARIRKLAGSLTSAVKPRATAKITRSDSGGLHLRLLMRSENGVGERNIDGKSCNDLAGAAAVALVLLLQSGSTDEEAARGTDTTQRDEAQSAAAASVAKTSAARAESGAKADAPSAPTAQAAPEASSHRSWRLLVQLPAAALGIGPVPGASFGVAAGAGVAFQRWQLLASGTLWLERRASFSDNFQEYGAEISHFTGQLLACRALGEARLELAPCATVAVQHVSARGNGAHIAPRTAQDTWLAVGAAAQARARVSSWFSISLGLGVEIETARPRLTLDSVGKVEQLLPVAGTLTLGAQWQL